MDENQVAGVMPLVYDELRRLALRMHRERNVSVHATSVVHETFLKLDASEAVAWRSRGHFLAIAAKAMRHILADRARRRHAGKRGAGWQQVTLDGVHGEADVADLRVLAEALDQLAALDARGAEVAEMRLLAGMTIAEIAAVTDSSERTVERDWRAARAWLHDRLSGEAG